MAHRDDYGYTGSLRGGFTDRRLDRGNYSAEECLADPVLNAQSLAAQRAAVYGPPNREVSSIEAAFDHDTAWQAAKQEAIARQEAQGELFKTRAAHLAATFKPRVMTVRVTPNEVGGGVNFLPGATFVEVAKLIDATVKSIGADAERQARAAFATQLADHLAGIQA